MTNKKFPGRTPLAGVIMGSVSDWETMKEACGVLEELEVVFEKQVVSAHRTPEWLACYSGEAQEKGLKVIIAGAGGAAHLPGMVAAQTLLPGIGVPVLSSSLNGMDSLLSIVQMPRGVLVATVTIGRTGAHNAGLLAAQILSLNDPKLLERLTKRRASIRDEVLDTRLP